MLESATHFSLVLLLGRFSCQIPISGPSFSVVIVSATSLSYFHDDELFLWYSWPTKGVYPYLDPHHLESPTRREQDLNLRRT